MMLSTPSALSSSLRLGSSSGSRQPTHSATTLTDRPSTRGSVSMSLVCADGTMSRELDRARSEIESLKKELALAKAQAGYHHHAKGNPSKPGSSSNTSRIVHPSSTQHFLPLGSLAQSRESQLTTEAHQHSIAQYFANTSPRSFARGQQSSSSGNRRRRKDKDPEKLELQVKELTREKTDLTKEVETLNEKVDSLMLERDEQNAQNIRLVEENRVLKQKLSSIEVYSKDSTLYRALRQAELRIEQMERDQGLWSSKTLMQRDEEERADRLAKIRAEFNLRPSTTPVPTRTGTRNQNLEGSLPRRASLGRTSFDCCGEDRDDSFEEVEPPQASKSFPSSFPQGYDE